jgi:hypothetical protein
MSIHIIRLDASDDVASVGDQLALVRAKRAVLVWPDRGRPLNSRLDLALLQRRARELGIQLAVVTRDGSVRFNAAGLGIPVFRKMEQAQSRPWRSGRRNTLSIHSRRSLLALRAMSPRSLMDGNRFLNSLPVRLAAFSAAVLAVLGLAGFMLPSAEIRVQAPRTAQTIRWQGSAVLAGEATDSVSVIPLRTAEMVVEATSSRLTTSVVRTPVQPASGSAQFTNLTLQPVTIPVGTVIASAADPAQRFVTVAAAQAPAGIGKTAAVSIRAVNPGPVGNLEKDAIQSIEGPLGLSLTVTNPAPTSGGTDRAFPAPGDADRAQLKAGLMDTLRSEALTQARSQVPPGSAVIAASLSSGEVIADQSFPPDREPSDRLEQTLRARYTVLYLAGDDLQQAGVAALDAALPSGFRPVGAGIQVKLAGEPVIEADGQVKWEIEASRSIEPVLPLGEIADRVRGRPVDQGIQLLVDAYHLPASPSVRTVPQGWPWLPFLPFRIDVKTG